MTTQRVDPPAADKADLGRQVSETWYDPETDTGQRPARRWVRFPCQPLLRAAVLKGFRTTTELRLALRTSSSELAGARLHGITWIRADEWAVRLGLHPVMIWPDWYEKTDARMRPAREVIDATVPTPQTPDFAAMLAAIQTQIDQTAKARATA